MNIGSAIIYIKVRDCTFFLGGYVYDYHELSEKVTAMIERYIEEREPWGK